MRQVYVLTMAVTAAAMTVGACAQGNLPQPVQAAVDDLAARLGVAAELITVESMERVTWPDASLGNPEPGRAYAQVMTQGYRVALEAGGQRYVYHTDMATAITLVEAPEPPGAAPAPPAQGDVLMQRLELIRRAKLDLAQRLGIAPGTVYLAAVEEVVWPDTSLGLVELAGVPTQVQTPGYRMLLEAPDGIHPYHTDISQKVVPADGTSITGFAPREYPKADAPPVATATADLARRLGIDPAQIEVLEVEAVQWPDGSLGLPEPGMMYTQAIVPGWRIVLGAQGRAFEYHAPDGPAARLAGVVYDEDAEVSVLALQRTEPTDGNNFFHLQRVDPQTGTYRVIVQFVSDFAATSDGRDIAVIRRTSRSGHELGYVDEGGEFTRLDGAFDFRTPAWSPLGERLAYWARSGLGAPPALRVLRKPWEEPIELTLPGLEPGSFDAGALVWTQDGLAITVYPEDARAPRSLFWDGEAMQELGAYEVLCWIPRTRVLAARAGSGDIVALAPGLGETTTLIAGRVIASVDAPAQGQELIAVEAGEGSLRLLRAPWGGPVTQLATMTGASEAAVRVSPLGDIAAVSYLMDDEPHTDLLRLNGTAELMSSINEPAPAIPVAQ
ncbi:MAG: hypothetical protein AB7Y46_12870 [Armatimonadota bacterium]